MTNKTTTITSTMARQPAKTTQIQMRVSLEVKAELEKAATARGQSMTGYLLWCASQQDKNVLTALLEAL